jgi:hypothetical protein
MIDRADRGVGRMLLIRRRGVKREKAMAAATRFG